MQAIVAATRAAAECLERPELGTLEPGKAADVVVVDGDPIEDIEVLGRADRVHLVMKEGVVHKDWLGEPTARRAPDPSTSSVGA
jgi:imidazolonepropionase-like amidohydrolase